LQASTYNLQKQESLNGESGPSVYITMGNGMMRKHFSNDDMDSYEKSAVKAHNKFASFFSDMSPEFLNSNPNAET
jgi:hypothetical protein